MEFHVGDRVVIAKQRATVRYVGPVDGHEGIWVGVEWDDASRGKHDGATGGRRFFSCSSTAPTAASFVRINKVSSGVGLVDAVVLRYTNQLAEGHASATDAQQPYVSTASNKKLWVELVGQEQVTARQSKLELLTSARLVGANVSSVGPAGKLGTTVPSLRQLDLTDNLIGSWSAAASICQQLPSLTQLNLSLNKLQLPSHLPDAGLLHLPGLHCLVLNQCAITWQQVAVLQSSLPNLQELHIAGNNISSLHVQLDASIPQGQKQQEQQQQQQRPPLVGFKSLQVLGLEDNSINSWAEVLRLAGLPNLQRLSLSGNPISSITYPQHSINPTALFSSSTPDVAAATPSTTQQQPRAASRDEEGSPAQRQQEPCQAPFAHLQALLLGDCRISSWGDVDQLNLFPALWELRLSGNPLFTAEGTAAGAGRRFEVIGRVSGLKLLNGADVKPRERRDCELRYLQNVLAEQAEAAAAAAGQQQQQQQQQLTGQHPRLAELQARYGQVSAVAAVTLSRQQGSTLSSSTCELLLHCGSSRVKKKLPKTVTVAALRLLCSRLFKLAPDQMQLQLVGPSAAAADDDDGQPTPAAPAHVHGEDIGQDDTKQLSYWDVTDGCVVQITHADPDQQRLQRDAEQMVKQKEHEQRMAQQLQQGEALRSAAAEA